MNKAKFGLIFLLTVFMLAAAPAVIAQEHPANNECTNIDQHVRISADANQDAFNVTQFKVNKGACVMISFENKATVEHVFQLENATSKTWVHLHLHNNTDTTYGMPGIATANVTMPNKDITLDFYCTIPGHRSEGMEGTIVVGAGSSNKAPLEFAPVLGAILLLGIAVPVLNKRKH